MTPSMSRLPRLIAAPSNLGLRPAFAGHIPGTGRAPDAIFPYLPAQLTRDAIWLSSRPYAFDTDVVGTIGNAQGIRAQTLELAGHVAHLIDEGQLPVVVGGDCSLLLGGLLGAACRQRIGLVHVDGHSDFYHPGNYDPARAVNSVAGMDLALATGRGEPLLTRWDGVKGGLVEDADVVQIGEREETDADYAFSDIRTTAILSLPVRRLLTIGPAAATAAALAHFDRAFWLHVDLDVLDASVFEAVDSPGSPGLDWPGLSDLCRGLMASGRVVGVSLCIYDPDKDPERIQPPRIARFLSALLGLADKEADDEADGVGGGRPLE